MTKKAKTLTAQDLKRLLNYISTTKHSARNRAIVMLMYNTGMRVGEAASLRYKDIVDELGNVKREIQLRPDQTKGGYARTIFVNDRLYKELAQYIKAVPITNLKNKLFYSQKKSSDGFTANTLCQYYYFLFKGAGIDGASSHSPRRSFITELASKGIGVRILASLAGHRSIQTTQEYIDVNDQQKRRAVELLN
jgi:integrase/recombinase XerD